MKKRVRLVDVAQESNVSLATVSRILNKDETFSTTDETRERVHAVALRLGYFPDLRAQNLRRQKTGIFGIFEWIHSSRNQLSQYIVEGVEERIREADHETIYRLQTRKTQFKSILPWRVDGVIIMQHPSAEVIDGLTQLDMPFVCVNEKAEGSVGNVVPDEEQGINLGLNHLQELGHTKIAFADSATNSKHFSRFLRQSACAEWLKAKGLESITGELEDNKPEHLKALIDRGATALIAYNCRVAITILRSASLLGLTVPEDLSIVAFDDVFPAAKIYPSITTIGMDAREMGRLGASMLLDNLKGTPESPLETLVPYYLTVRESTAPPKGAA